MFRSSGSIDTASATHNTTGHSTLRSDRTCIQRRKRGYSRVAIRYMQARHTPFWIESLFSSIFFNLSILHSIHQRYTSRDRPCVPRHKHGMRPWRTNTHQQPHRTCRSRYHMQSRTGAPVGIRSARQRIDIACAIACSHSHITHYGRT